MKPTGQNVSRATVTAVAGVGNELVVEPQVQIFDYLGIVMDPLRRLLLIPLQSERPSGASRLPKVLQPFT